MPRAGHVRSFTVVTSLSRLRLDQPKKPLDSTSPEAPLPRAGRRRRALSVLIAVPAWGRQAVNHSVRVTPLEVGDGPTRPLSVPGRSLLMARPRSAAAGRATAMVRSKARATSTVASRRAVMKRMRDEDVEHVLFWFTD